MYEILMTRKAQKFYDKAENELVLQLNECFDNLSQNPYQGSDIKKLKGNFLGYWRYRIGDYRVVYLVDEKSKNITIFLIAHRKDVYR
ncbi:type II toxin-antitoxin system RelE family toxin [Tumidithrix helvetica]|uniref:type II toxin-antitoxin system RelE family toxin n=1 Tax=Tumidithrix helvetica TaxID=3457545 RepID=UPI003CC6CFA4